MECGIKYGLIGESLSHSYSKAIHGFLGNHEYGLLELRPDAVEGFLGKADFQGINVTIPYKETVMPHCVPDVAAEKIGSVNTIVNKGGKLYGYNTDYSGFSYMAKNAGIDFAGKKVLVLGSGGTSKTAVCVARDSNAREIVVVSRNGKDNYENIGDHADADILVNTTPVGMFPDNGLAPVSLDCFKGLSAVIDVIYNPLRTRLLLDAMERGIKTANGLAMLTAQALYAHNLFFGIEPGEDAGGISNAGGMPNDDGMRISETLAKTEKLFQNVVLIGMPGSGKTSVGKKLAKILEMDFVDTDLMIEANAGRKVHDIIRMYGEPYFRKQEASVIARVAAKTCQVIATGGGSVLAKENRDALLQNGTIVFLERNLACLSTEDRPLSVDLQTMYYYRRPIYEGLCHHKVKAGDSLEDTVDKVRQVLS
ncbi:MAG: hypothetical protein FWD88_00300 [Treponema sp.]|nr:hypothetical protein [Treponema sp.]